MSFLDDIGTATGNFVDGAANSVRDSFNRMQSSDSVPTYNRTAYQVHIYKEGSDNVITAFLPEEFQFDLTSDWDPSFSEGVSDSNKVNMALQLMGTKPATQAMTTQMWKGSSNMEIVLALEFIAETDTIMDVRKPIMDLVALALPTTLGGEYGLFRSPGPTYDINKIIEMGIQAKNQSQQESQQLEGDDTKGASQSYQENKIDTIMKNKISLHIGNFIRLNNVVITNIGQAYKTLIHPSGIPIRATVSVTFRTVMVPTATDIRRAFGA